MGRQPCAADDGTTIPEPPADVAATLYAGMSLFLPLVRSRAIQYHQIERLTDGLGELL